MKGINTMTSPLWFRDRPNLDMYLNIQFNTLKKNDDKMRLVFYASRSYGYGSNKLFANILPPGFGAAFLIPKNQPFHYVDPKQYQIFEP
jgi:hypothetical protein